MIAHLSLFLFAARHNIIKIVSVGMKLTFTNKKENKNCLYFIRALHEIEKHNLKDNRKPVFLYASKEELRLAPNLADLHKERTEDGCLVTFKSDVYSLVFDEAV